MVFGDQPDYRFRSLTTRRRDRYSMQEARQHSPLQAERISALARIRLRANSLRKFTRLTDWWHYKISYLFVPLYFLLPYFNGSVTSAIGMFLGTLGYLSFTAAVGHIINDWGDVEADARASKPNACSGISTWKIITLLLATVGCSLVCLFAADAPRVAYIAAGIELALFISYSLPPLRLKESSAGLLADAGYAHIMPWLIIIAIAGNHTSGQTNTNLTLIVAGILWQTFSGLRGILSHEIEDLPADRAAGLRTAVARIGEELSKTLIVKWLVPLELAALLLALALVTTTNPWPILGLGIYFYWSRHYRPDFRNITFTQSGDFKTWAHFLDPYYRRYLPLLILVGAIWFAPRLWPFLPLHLLLFQFKLNLPITRGRIRSRILQREPSLIIECRGCYLTSLLTTRNDINIYLKATVNGKKVAANIHYKPNDESLYYSQRGVTEPPVSFTLTIEVPDKKLTPEMHLQVTAYWDEVPSGAVVIHSQRFRLRP